MGKTVKVKIKREQLEPAVGCFNQLWGRVLGNDGAEIFRRIPNEIEIEIPEDQIEQPMEIFTSASFLKALRELPEDQKEIIREMFRGEEVSIPLHYSKPKRKRFKVKSITPFRESTGHEYPFVSIGNVVELEECE